jgi:hypothetical protein
LKTKTKTKHKTKQKQTVQGRAFIGKIQAEEKYM